MVVASSRSDRVFVQTGLGRSQCAAALGRVSVVACLVFALVACGTETPRERFARPKPGSRGAGAQHDASVRDAAVSGDANPSGDAASSDDAAVAPAFDLREACGAAPLLAGEFTRERLRSAAADCAMYRYCGFRAAARALDEAVSAYASDRSDARRAAARRAWRDAMNQWSEAELFQFGPAASVAESAGKDTFQGRGFRDRIYSWPSIAQCRVEEQVLAKPKTLDGVLISGRGLFAIELALFHSAAESACSASSETGQAWMKLSAAARDEQTASYARTVAADVKAQSEALVDAWSSDAGNFKPKFVSASGYPDEQTALNVLGWALVYVEKEVKDWKLGIPAGYTLTSPVSGPETPFAKVGTQSIRANLRGFRALYQGCGESNQGLGFDDWLSEVGHGELSAQLLDALAGAEKAIDSLGPLDTASKQKLVSTYEALRKLTDLLKGDLFGTGSPLNLKLPANVEGDTD